MKKISILAVLLLSVFVLNACGQSEVELPNLENHGRDAIREVMNDKGLETQFFVDPDVVYSHPNVFIRYMDYEIGDAVEPGTVVSVVVSNSLEEDDDDLEPAPQTPMDVEGTYTAPEDVALYVDAFGELPDNFLSKDEAIDLGYDPDENNLWDVADGMSLGGDPFEPEGDALPTDDQRSYFTADLNYEGGARTDERLVFSDDGLIYYTDDGYTTFEQLFGTPEHPPLDPDASYTDTEDVALYIRTFGKLPPNYFIRYEDDTSLYRSVYGSLPDKYDDFDHFNSYSDLRDAYGDDAYMGYWHFSNYAGQMPDDIMFYIADTKIGGRGLDRGNDRFVFSPDEKLVYYTDDHFQSHELWYGDARE